jgi:hypothetical protein
MFLGPLLSAQASFLWFHSSWNYQSQAAARVIRIGSRTDFMLGDILHPAINWADKESHVDPDEMAKVM